MESPSPYTPPATAEPSALEFPQSPVSQNLKHILFSFRGRISRRTFWLATLAVFLAFLIPAALIGPFMNLNQTTEIIGGILLFVLIIFLMWAGLAIRVKRWHDHGKSGWWVLVDAIPYLGGLVTFVVLGCLRGTVGPNAYGDDST